MIETLYLGGKYGTTVVTRDGETVLRVERAYGMLGPRWDILNIDSGLVGGANTKREALAIALSMAQES